MCPGGGAGLRPVLMKGCQWWSVLWRCLRPFPWVVEVVTTRTLAVAAWGASLEARGLVPGGL